MSKEYDIIIIGAGSGGLTAAFAAASIGAKTLLIEKEKHLGGDCLNYGCIPNKTLIRCAKIAKTNKIGLEYGLGRNESGSNIDTEKILSKVQETISYLNEDSDPIKHMNNSGVDVIIGKASFAGPTNVQVNESIYLGKKIIIAAGAKPKVPKIKNSNVGLLTSENIFFPKKFQSLTVYANEASVCDMAQAFALLGVKITLVKNSRCLLESEDKETNSLLLAEFEKLGIKVIFDHKLIDVSKKNSKKSATFQNSKDKKIVEIKSDEVMVSVGRKPNTENLNLEKAGIDYDANGIKINEMTQTSNKDVYAIGDITNGKRRTHFADHQARIAIINALFRFPSKYEKEVIPRIFFTDPEIASVGLNEDDIPADNHDLMILRKDFEEVERAIIDKETAGYIKIISDQKGFIKGATIVGHEAGELINMISLAIKNKIHISKFAEIIYPYPTYSYAFRNCAYQYQTKRYSEEKKEAVKKIFRLHGD